VRPAHPFPAPDTKAKSRQCKWSADPARQAKTQARPPLKLRPRRRQPHQGCVRVYFCAPSAVLKVREISHTVPRIGISFPRRQHTYFKR
jgi:hypothetical protein